jgi:transcription-repair coupling factor (superfamily II helicase)
MRAVFKCISDGRQAAVLVPTTVLASQHYATIVKRFEGVPANIAMLSRFVPAKKQKEILKNLKAGLVDIVIGTHRLLQQDIAFKNLGLVVIDEEQRFGVAHKEKLKEMTKTVDVLTITATPIPRTLNMAISGIRDMSVLEEPPSGRYPVSTYVMEHNWEIVADAIKRELRRGGQAYYLKNRIDAVDRTASKIKELVPDATVATAHGQMTEQQLSPVLMSFYNNATQVLCCTTIIESGVDIPNVNTIIIEDADHLGLSQLHQIRGRVGRSGVHAFAYLTFRKDRIISEIAQKRLSAIRENTEFGSGFKIAMRDLEIRGAGEILGAEQSGHMQAVGYDLYVEMLNEAVLSEQGRAFEKKTECIVDVFIDSHIPEKYIPSPKTRVEIYQKIAAVSSFEDAIDVTDELLDRFGDIPQSTLNLIDIALIRNLAQSIGISEITQKGKDVHLIFDEPDLKVVSGVLSLPEYKNKAVFRAASKPELILQNSAGDRAAPLKEFLQRINKLYQ